MSGRTFQWRLEEGLGQKRKRGKKFSRQREELCKHPEVRKIRLHLREE